MGRLDKRIEAFEEHIEEEVERRVEAELEQALDRLQAALSWEEYRRVCRVLADDGLQKEEDG